MVHDFNDDGWNDILIIGFPGTDTSWFENPKGKDGHWTRHKIFDQTDNESPTFTDLTGDGKPELVCITKGQYGYADAGLEQAGEAVDVPPDLAQQQIRQLHARPGRRRRQRRRPARSAREGRLVGTAARRSPAIRSGQFHEQPFGSGGAQMYAYDVNGDGLNDVITVARRARVRPGWFEQYRDGGEITFREHVIMNKEPRDNRTASSSPSSTPSISSTWTATA